MARKKKPAEHVSNERWLVSYADFITLLFAFFTTLYAISTIDKTKAGQLMYSVRTAFNVEIFKTLEEYMAYQGIAAPPVVIDGPPGIGAEGGPGEVSAGGGEQQSFDALLQDLMRMLEDPLLKQRVSLNVDERGAVLSLKEAGFFASGSAAMDPEAQAALDPLLGRLQAEPFSMIVEGHTDDRPIRSAKFLSNWELSTARATYVVARAVEVYNIVPTRLTAAGYGEHRPVADNSTEDGRAKNRRVDIVVLRPAGKPRPPQPPSL